MKYTSFTTYWETYLLIAIIILGAILRLYQLSINPPGLYIDEVSIGYNAYTILTKGVDEFGVHLPLWFRSFGDYKMPIYIYLTSLAMAVLGKSELAVRMPSALSGIGSILIVYMIVKNLVKLDKTKDSISHYLPILSAFLLAISPWAIQFSRGGFEVNVGCFFYLLFVYLLLNFFQTRKLAYFFISIIFSLIAVYTYHIFRIITPLSIFILSTSLLVKKTISYKVVLLGVIISAILYFPMLQFSLTPQGSERFAQTSTFSEYPVHSVTEKILVYPLVLLKNYLSFFSSPFLFEYGDGIGRHQLPDFGVQPKWTFPFLLIGCYYACRMRKRLSIKLISLFLLIAPLAAILARPSPQSLRSLLMVFPLVTFIAFGMLYTIFSVNKKRLIVVLMALLIGAESIYYIHFYYVDYPRVNVLDWGAGYKDIVLKASKLHNKYPKIVVDANLSYAPIYFRFYNPQLHITTVKSSWLPPINEERFKILYIRPYYGQPEEKNVVETVYLHNANHDVYAQLKKIE